MNINDRITVDENAVYQFLETSLDKLQPIKYDTKYRMLLGDELINKLTEWEAGIRRQKDVPLTVVVCGEFKRGKSSFLNAFLGEDVVTTNITTETITVNRISYGEHSNELVLEGGKRVILTDEELKCENLREILAQIDTTDRISMLELKRPIEVLKDVTFIDTPGLGDSLKDFTKEVNYALKMADAVVYVFSALYPVSVGEQFFIKHAITSQNYTELFLVSNFSDILGDEESCNRVQQVIGERIADILPGEAPYMISSLKERTRQLTAENEGAEEDAATAFDEYLAGNFEKLRFAFNALLEAKRKSVIPDRINRMVTSMITDLEKEIANINAALSLSSEELDAKKKEFNASKTERSAEFERISDEIDDKNEFHRSEAVGWLEAFVDLLEKDANTLTAAQGDEIKKYYSVFCIDAMQQAIGKCNDYFVNKIYEGLDKVSTEIAKNMSMQGNADKINFRFDLETRTWTKGDNVSFWGQSLVGDSVVVSLLSGFMREKELKKNAVNVVEEVKKQFPELRNSVLPALASNFSEISEDAKKHLAEYFVQSRNELEDRINKASEIACKDEQKKAEIKTAADEISLILCSIRENLTF